MSHSLQARGKRSAWKIALYSIGAIAIAMLLAGVLLFLFLPDIVVKTYVKGRIIQEFTEAYPAYAIRIGGIQYSVQENRIGFDSVALMSKDSTFSCTIAAYSVSGIGWWNLLWAGGIVPNGFSGTALDAHDVALIFSQGMYELRCKRLYVSVPDSELVVDDLKLQPSGDDERFFAGSKFRQTRFRLAIPHARITGLACLELLQGKVYRTRSINLHEPYADVLINKDKPAARDSSRPPMPNEILAPAAITIHVDSVNIWNGGLKYGERFAARPKPGELTWDNVEASIRGIDNRGDAGDTLLVSAKGTFLKSGEMRLLMSIPIASQDFSFQYSGSLRRMKLNALNPFLEVADGMRFKSGVLQSASFDIHVVDGRAGGSVRAVYKDLSLAAINRRTGSEEGFLDVIASFVANNITIRTDNMPDKAGAMKIGNVAYSRRRDDPFFGFVWFALRSGVGDVVGF